MADELSRDERIKKEVTRLKRLLKLIPKDKMSVAEGIVKRVAFMQVTLEDLEADINEHGTVESFSQSPGVEYDRQRPAATIYNTTIKNYTAATKQLADLLPDGDKTKSTADELIDFVKKNRR